MLAKKQKSPEEEEKLNPHLYKTSRCAAVKKQNVPKRMKRKEVSIFWPCLLRGRQKTGNMFPVPNDVLNKNFELFK